MRTLNSRWTLLRPTPDRAGGADENHAGQRALAASEQDRDGGGGDAGAGRRHLAELGNIADAARLREPPDGCTKAAPARAPPVQPDAAQGLSAYEKERLRNIARNLRLLASLGLLHPREPPAEQRRAARRAPAKRARQLSAAASAPPAPRRSTRARSGPLAAQPGQACAAEARMAAAESAAPGAPPGAERGVRFERSAVLRYVLSARGHARLPAGGDGAPYSEIRGFRRCARLADCVSSKIARAYALDLAPAGRRGGWLVAAAGEKGLVEVYGLAANIADGEEDAGSASREAGALLFFEAHHGWVGGVQLLAACSSPPPGADDGSGAGTAEATAGSWLLSAANDGALRLWDLRAAAREGARAGAPQLVSALTEPHAGKGIFAMHEREGRVLTASKDGSVGLSALTPSGLRAERAWADCCGGGVVKSVCWHPGAESSHALGPATFAAGGRAGAVALVDARAAGGRAAVRLEGAHPHDVHCVRWQPPARGAAGCAWPLLLTASFDPVIRLWDLRQLAQPVAELRGHVGAGTARQKRIHQPCSVGSGRVAASGEGSDALSLYSSAPSEPAFGSAVSRARVGWEPSTLAPAPGASGCVAAAHGKAITLLEALPDKPAARSARHRTRR